MEPRGTTHLLIYGCASRKQDTGVTTSSPSSWTSLAPYPYKAQGSLRVG